jgi:hypothetical protein
MSQHFYSCVSDSDKVPPRSVPFQRHVSATPGEELPAEAVAAGLSLLTERSLLLADRQGDDGPRYLLPVTLRAYGHQMLRRLGQDEEFAARHKRWQDDRRPHQGGWRS